MFVVRGRLHDDDQQRCPVEVFPVEDLRSCCGAQLPEGWETTAAEAALQQPAQTPIVEDRVCSGAEALSPAVIPEPEAPTLRDQLQHAVTHVPLAPWCPV